ncbi:hypothetical protein Syun_016737 [Stephania yunnanensis]|uniref:Uncharacterized protein n=1 Tax=Stephania yunnanensis TaxID=152371 RepID=A0AAP0J6K6_9MAGN
MLDDGHRDEGEVSGGDASRGEGISVEIEYIDNKVEGDKSGDGESEEDEVNFVSHESSEEEVKVRDHVNGELSREKVTIDDHVVGDPTKEYVKDRSTPLESAPMEHGIGGEDIMGEVAPLKLPPLEQLSIGVTSSPLMLQEINQLLEERFHSLQIFMEAQFNQVDNMLPTTLNLLHRDMETMLIRVQDLVEKINQSRKMVADFVERFDALLWKYEKQLSQRDGRKKWNGTWKPDHVDLDANL